MIRSAIISRYLCGAVPSRTECIALAYRMHRCARDSSVAFCTHSMVGSPFVGVVGDGGSIKIDADREHVGGRQGA